MNGMEQYDKADEKSNSSSVDEELQLQGIGSTNTNARLPIPLPKTKTKPKPKKPVVATKLKGNKPVHSFQNGFNIQILMNNELVWRHLDFDRRREKVMLIYIVYTDPYHCFELEPKHEFKCTPYSAQTAVKNGRPPWAPPTVQDNHWDLRAKRFWFSEDIEPNDFRINGPHSDELWSIMCKYRPDLIDLILERLARQYMVSTLSLQPLKKLTQSFKTFGYEQEMLNAFTVEDDVIPYLYHFFGIAIAKCMVLGIYPKLMQEKKNYEKHLKDEAKKNARANKGKRNWKELLAIRQGLIKEFNFAKKKKKAPKKNQPASPSPSPTKSDAKTASMDVNNGDGDELDLLQYMRFDLYEMLVKHFAQTHKMNIEKLDFLVHGLRQPRLFGLEHEFFDDFTWEDDVKSDIKEYNYLLVQRAKRMGVDVNAWGIKLPPPPTNAKTAKGKATQPDADKLDLLQQLRPDLFEQLLKDFCTSRSIGNVDKDAMQKGRRTAAVSKQDKDIYPKYTYASDIIPDMKVYTALIFARAVRLNLSFVEYENF